MAIADFGSLRSEVQAYCGRSDSTFSGRVEQFVSLAEDRIYLGQGADAGDPLYSAPVRSKIMETTTTVSVTDGDGTLPSSCLSARRITRGSTDTYGLSYLTPDALQLRLAQASGGLPQYYTVEGLNLKIAPTYTGDLTILYYQRFDPITLTNPTGSLLSEHSQLYFSACMFEAFSFMQEPDLAIAWLGRYRSMVAGINQTSADLRYAGRRLRINARPIE